MKPSIRCCLSILLPFLLAPSAAWGDQGEVPVTRLVWARAGQGAAVQVTGTSEGTRHPQAHGEVQAVADRLEALRTVRPHVVWKRIVWEDGRVEVEAEAEDGVHGAVALMAVRGLYPGRRTAGSGVQQVRAPVGQEVWRVVVRIGPPDSAVDRAPVREHDSDP